MSRFCELVSSREILVFCLLTVSLFATASRIHGHLAENPIRSTARHLAFCFVREAGLECYQVRRHLPIENSRDSLVSISEFGPSANSRNWSIHSGAVRGRLTSNSRSRFRSMASLPNLTDPHISISERRSNARPGSNASALLIPVSVVPFSDGFESGDMSAWSSVYPDRLPVIVILEP